MNVVVSAEAEADLEAIADWIGRDNPSRAISFVGELTTACQQLGEMPRSYPLVPRYGRSGIRRRPYRSYLIFYRAHADRVEILHVLHAARDYDAILSSLGE